MTVRHSSTLSLLVQALFLSKPRFYYVMLKLMSVTETKYLIQSVVNEQSVIVFSTRWLG